MPRFLVQIIVAVLVIVNYSFARAGESHDVAVCDALRRLSQLRNQQVQLVGTLQGTFYHGFGLAGRPDFRPCAPPSFKWFPSPQALGFILVQITSKEQKWKVPPEIMSFEQAIGSHGVLVRANGVLRTPSFLFTICLRENDCFGNGYYNNRSPALLELHSIEVLDTKTAAK